MTPAGRGNLSVKARPTEVGLTSCQLHSSACFQLLDVRRLWKDARIVVYAKDGNPTAWQGAPSWGFGLKAA